ncbi:MAG: hypothetical protein Q4C97_04105 [Bacillota bacterium]|nr:hypothetical protein [Bacillota bacterium]
MKLFGKEFKFNDFDVYHKGNKPTPGEIGTYTSEEIDQKITSAQGAKVYVSTDQPSEAKSGDVWL